MRRAPVLRANAIRGGALPFGTLGNHTKHARPPSHNSFVKAPRRWAACPVARARSRLELLAVAAAATGVWPACAALACGCAVCRRRCGLGGCPVWMQAQGCLTCATARHVCMTLLVVPAAPRPIGTSWRAPTQHCADRPVWALAARLRTDVRASAGSISEGAGYAGRNDCRTATSQRRSMS